MVAWFLLGEASYSTLAFTYQDADGGGNMML